MKVYFDWQHAVFGNPDYTGERNLLSKTSDMLLGPLPALLLIHAPGRPRPGPGRPRGAGRPEGGDGPKPPRDPPDITRGAQASGCVWAPVGGRGPTGAARSRESGAKKIGDDPCGQREAVSDDGRPPRPSGCARAWGQAGPGAKTARRA